MKSTQFDYRCVMEARRRCGAVSITVKNLPAEVHRRLRARAAKHRRSLNSEVVACLTATVMAEWADTETLVARALALRGDVEDDDPAPRGGEVGGQPERAGGGRGEVVRDEDGAEANGGQAGQAPLTSRLRRLGGLRWRSSR